MLMIRREETWVKSVWFSIKTFPPPLRSSSVEAHLAFFAYLNKNNLFLLRHAKNVRCALTEDDRSGGGNVLINMQILPTSLPF